MLCHARCPSNQFLLYNDLLKLWVSPDNCNIDPDNKAEYAPLY